MKQLIQNFRTGAIELVDVPCPPLKPGHILVKTHRSLLSSGTERTMTEFATANLINKARQRPDQIKSLLTQIQAQGVNQTVKSIKDRLERFYPLGYCNMGTVIEVGEGVEKFRPNMRVVCNGHHAEIVLVPKNLCAKVPDNVDDNKAVFTILGSIALQGIRISEPTLGERFVVIGLGVVGLLTAQILRAHGCLVLAIDPDSKRTDIARQFGAETLTSTDSELIMNTAKNFSSGMGVDGVLITAATTSNEPVHNAAQMCRKRGRITLIGTTGLNLHRSDFYEKELSFKVSCSYGPGRYDPIYEETGNDYPTGYVRWTEQRNFTAVLQLMSNGGLETEELISHRYPFDNATEAYDLLLSNSPSLGIILDYKFQDDKRNLFQNKTITLSNVSKTYSEASPSLALIGAGNYAKYSLLPAIEQYGARLHTLISNGRPEASKLAARYKFENLSTDIDEALANEEINCVVIATRHDSHADLTCKALSAGKNVFVEKPIAISQNQIIDIENAYTSNKADPAILMVGYNRRFAPHIVDAKYVFQSKAEPKSLFYTINAGKVPNNHWVLSPHIGGGRIIGEVCHFVDLACFLIGSEVVSLHAAPVVNNPHESDDGISATIQFSDGSIAIINYITNGHEKVPKERIELHSGNTSLLINDFKNIQGHGLANFHPTKLKKQDKGNTQCIHTFLKCVSEGIEPPITFYDIISSTKIVLRIDELKNSMEQNFASQIHAQNINAKNK